MPKPAKSPEMSESELRRLLLDRRRRDRARRLDAFRREGALLPLDARGAESLEADPLSGPRVHADPNLKLEAPTQPRSWADRLLLGVEVLAVIGLLVVFLSGLNLLGDLNSQVSALFTEGLAASPTPILRAVVLPSGHTPPTRAGGAQPNEAEIPEHLRPLVQSYNAAVVLPTPGPEQAIGIRIEALSVNAPVVQGDGWEELKRGVAQHLGTANPGENGNMVLSGHNDIYGEVFRYLSDLEEGDEIVIFTQSRSYTYRVMEKMIVAPTFVEVMDPTEDATLTLISCYPYLIDTQRIVVRAELQPN
jgi:sortase A